MLMATAIGCRSEVACDIREEACQRDLFYLVLEARGQAWDAWASPPPMEVITRDEYRSFLENAASSDDGSSLSWDPAYKLLGFLDRDASSTEASIDSKVESVVAFYSSATRRVTIIDHGEPRDPMTASMILAHEIVHALQDRDVGLLLYFEGATTSDEYMALRSMIEGDATFYELLVNLRIRQLEFEKVDWRTYFEGYRADVDRAVASSPGRLERARSLLPYVAGAQYLQHAYAQGGPPEVEFAFLAKPPSLAAVVDAQLAPAPAPVRTPLSCPGPPTPAGYERVGSSRLGAAGLHAFAVKSRAGPLVWDLMRAWSDDRLRFYQSPEGASAVAWTVRLNEPTGYNTLSSVAQSLVTQHGARSQTRLGELEIVIAAADDPAVLPGWNLQACAE